MLCGDSKTYTIQIRQRGQATIPRRLRESLAIEEGDTLTAFQVGDALCVSFLLCVFTGDFSSLRPSLPLRLGVSLFYCHGNGVAAIP